MMQAKIDILTINLRRGVSDLICRLRCLSILLLLHISNSRDALCVSTNKLPDNLHSCGRTAGLSSEDFARFVNHKDATRCAFRRLLQSNSSNKRLGRIAQQCVRELFVGFKGRVRFGTIVREAINAVAGRSKGFVGVAEEACLCGACDCALLATHTL
jgi:hypothetical protein